MVASDEAIMIGGHPLSGLLQGARYRVNRLAGWWERPAVKRQAVSRAGGDGDFPMPWHFEARRIGIDGHIHCTSHGQMHHIMDQLNALAVTGREWLSIQGHGPTTAALVEADEQPFLHPVTDTILRFELRFKANDPRRYGQPHNVPLVGGENTYRQWGNYPSPIHAHPALTVTAAGQGYTLTTTVDGVPRIWECFGVPGMSSLQHHADISAGVHTVEGEPVPQHMGRMHTWFLPGKGLPTTVTAEVLDGGSFLSAGRMRFWDTYI